MEAVEKSAENIIKLIERLAFNYFNKYQTLEDLHTLLNEMPFQAMKIRNDKYHNEVLSGFFRGILTAGLLNENIDALVREHMEYLTANDYGVENLKHYTNFLQWVHGVHQLDKFV